MVCRSSQKYLVSGFYGPTKIVPIAIHTDSIFLGRHVFCESILIHTIYGWVAQILHVRTIVDFSPACIQGSSTIIDGGSAKIGQKSSKWCQFKHPSYLINVDFPFPEFPPLNYEALQYSRGNLQLVNVYYKVT